MRLAVLWAVFAAPSVAMGQAAQKPANASDSVTIRIVGTELRSAVQIIQQYLDRPIIFSGPGAGPQVTLETPRPVAREDVPKLLRGLLDSQGYELVADSSSGTYRARAKDQAPSRPPSMALAQFPVQQAASPHANQTPELFVIALRHARAADVASTINALFGHAPANGTQPPINPPPSSVESERRMATLTES